MGTPGPDPGESDPLRSENAHTATARALQSSQGPPPPLNQNHPAAFNSMTTLLTNPLRVGLRQERVISPQCIVIFGASGDLTHRKLVPALFELFRQRRLPSEFAVLGCARRPWSDEEFRSKMAEAMADTIAEHPGAWEHFAQGMFYEPVDLQQSDHLVRLGTRLETIDRLRATRGNRTFYLSVSPEFYGSGCRALASAGLLADPERSRVVIEKPFGRDYGSAQALNKVVQACAKESQIFRIDHYLGKETVQNILVLRFANTIFEPIWNRNYIANVQITAAETVGVEERAGYYESSGALRDMVQNHLTQILALTTMEPPGRFDAEAIRNEKAKVLQAAHLANEQEPWQCCVRGQYSSGGTAARPLSGYRDEPGVNPNSTTETYVAMKLFIDNWRWQGVPIYLRAGKCMPMTATEVRVEFHRPPAVVFPNEQSLPHNYWRFLFSPRIEVGLNIQVKADGERMVGQDMELMAVDQSADEMTPYERRIGDALRGDQTLFARQDVVEEAWRIVDPILGNAVPVHRYKPGTWGPDAANEILLPEGGWHAPQIDGKA